MTAGFELFGEASPASPVILSVPHAGRDYPLALRAALRVPPAALVVLEDRYVDVVAHAARGHETMLVQHRARAWIDLNRHEQERDPAIDEGAASNALPQASAKLRGGLGLVPRRVNGAGELWRRRFEAGEIDARIVADYRPYHAALAEALAAGRDRFGCAVLLDVHSMPSLPGAGPQIVLGDRFGRSAASRFVARLEAEARAHGLTVALNTPYAGSHILDRHGGGGVHAVQIELDRKLYLDAAGDAPGDGLAATARVLRAMIDSATDEAMVRPALAAE